MLTAQSDRVAYIRQVAPAVKPGGSVIVSTFGPDGPTKCSGLEVVRYDAESLHEELGARFRLLGTAIPLLAAHYERRRRNSLPATIILTTPMVTRGQYCGQKSEAPAPSKKLPRRMIRK